MWWTNHFEKEEMMFKKYQLTVFIIILADWYSVPGVNSQQCTREYQLLSTQQILNVSSPNYPSAYVAGTSCRYRITAPLDHIVVLNCRWEVYPNNCGTEFFYVSLDGDLEFRDGEIFCSNNIFTRNSRFRSVSFAYYSQTAQTSLHGRFFCQAYARQQSCSCGWSSGTRITNGREAALHEYPHIVALRDITSSQRLFCGGNIISHRHIITAAHCTRAQPDVTKVLAYVGDHDLSISNESPYAAQYRIIQFINHPSYSSSSVTAAKDIALCVTATNIEWSQGVGPICLPFRQAGQSFAYINVDVIGWGTVAFAGSKSNTLQKIQLLTMDNSACQQEYNGSILQSHICTYDFRGLGQDSCQYDSGGSVIAKQQRMLLVGVISFGRTCGTRYGIGVNTRITTHLNWIWSYVRSESSSVCSV